jgi:hypothetical protein
MKSLFIIAALMLAACSQRVTFEEPYYLQTIEKRIPARLDAKLANLTEQDIHQFDVGRALAYAIQNDPNAPISISYVDSTMTYALSPAFFITPGAQAEYKLTVLVVTESRREVMEGSARGGSHVDAANAYQEAIERAVMALHRKVVALFPRKEKE